MKEVQTMLKKESIIGIDNGKEMLKISWNYVDIQDLGPENECNICDKSFDSYSKLRSHKNTVHQIKDDSIAHKSMILFAAQKTDKNYANLAIAMNEANLDAIDYKLSEDLKCTYIVSGLQNHSARHPCPYGNCKKCRNGLWEKGQDRTVEDISKINHKWLEETGGDRDKLKDYFNCQNQPLLNPNGTGDTKVLLVSPPPPLHNGKLGPVNDLMELSAQICPNETSQYLKENHITKEAYHGGELIGEQCDKVMDTIDKLEYLYPDEHKSIIDGFKAVKIVNKALCGRVLMDH